MNILFNLVTKNLKINKRKSLLVIISIIFSTCLITTIGILSYSLQQMELRRTIGRTGDVHVEYKKLNENQVEILKKSRKLNSVSEYIKLGSSRKYLPYIIDICYRDKFAGKNINCFSLKEGRWPEKEKDIAMSKWILEEIGVSPKIGQKITLTYSDEKDKESKSDFIVCGILDNGDLLKNDMNKAVAVVSKDYVLKNVKSENINLAVTAKVNGRNIKNIAYEVGHDIGLDNKKINVNMHYINILGLYNNTFIAACIVGIIVIFATVLVIYNIFYISIKERIRQFGMISAIGGTRKQIRKLVFKEGIILSFIGITGGVILGCFLSCYMIPLIHVKGNLRVKFSPYIVILSIFVSLFTIIISLRKPSEIASKISPIQAIRYSEVVIVSNKKKRKSDDRVTLSKLAYYNLWRNKKSTFVTIISMALTGILFIVFFSTFSSLRDKHKRVISNTLSEFELSSINIQPNNNDDKNDYLDKSVLDKVKALNGVKDINILKFKTGQIYDKKIVSQYNSWFKDQNKVDKLNYNFHGFDNCMLDKLGKYVIEGQISPEKLKNKDEIIMKEYSKNLYKVGDKVTLEYKDYDKKTTVKKQFTIAAIVSSSIKDSPYIGPTFITHEAAFSREFNDNRIGKLCIDVNKDSYNNIKTNLKNISKSSNNKILYFDRQEFIEKNNLELEGIEIIAVSILVLIGSIGSLNCINTMITSVLSRKKEFGMLQAIGMSNIQLRKLLQIEGLYYSSISAIIAITFGILFSYILIDKLRFVTELYKIPFMAIVLVVTAFMLIQLLITYLMEKVLRKESIIDRIRYS